MSKYTSSESLVNDVLKLLKTGSLGFNDIKEKVRKGREDQGKRRGSTASLSDALKELQDGGYVGRDIRTRKYYLTHSGRANLNDPLNTLKFKSRHRGVEPSQRDIVEFLVEAFVDSLKATGGERIELPDSYTKNVSDQVRQFANGRTSAIRKLWTDVTETFTGGLNTLLTGLMLMQVTHGAVMSEEQVAVAIRKAVTIWSRFRIGDIENALSSYFSHPEVLAALDKALREHSFKENLASAPFEHVCRTLKRQEYL